CLTVLERVRPGMDSIERRLTRNEALDVLSSEYAEIERAEAAGDFAAATAGYDRLLRGYGDGPLRATFEERRTAATRARDVQAEVKRSLEAGDVADAQARLRALAAELEDLQLASRVGFPVRVTTLPAGATVKLSGRAAGVAPTVV